jgi:hypothetical protein
LHPPNHSFHDSLNGLPLVRTFVLPLYFYHAQPLRGEV